MIRKGIRDRLERGALGRKPPASAKSPRLEQHPVLGTPRSLKGRSRAGR